MAGAVWELRVRLRAAAGPGAGGGPRVPRAGCHPHPLCGASWRGSEPSPRVMAPPDPPQSSSSAPQPAEKKKKKIDKN